MAPERIYPRRDKGGVEKEAAGQSAEEVTPSHPDQAGSPVQSVVLC
jgi:hypothetical protein